MLTAKMSTTVKVSTCGDEEIDDDGKGVDDAEDVLKKLNRRR